MTLAVQGRPPVLAPRWLSRLGGNALCALVCMAIAEPALLILVPGERVKWLRPADARGRRLLEVAAG